MQGTLPGFKCRVHEVETLLPFGAIYKVLHGCRQLVP